MPHKVQAPARKPPDYWSWSAYHQHTRECPRSYRYARVERRPTGPKGPPLIRGDEIHKEGEAFLKAKRVGKVPASYSAFEREMKALRQLKAEAEQQWCFTRNWEVSAWDAWGTTWLRTKLDANFTVPAARYGTIAQLFRDGEVDYVFNLDDLIKNIDLKNTKLIMDVIDFKTGKVRDGYGEQTELYALCAFKMFPEVDLVAPAFWFLDQGEIVGGPHATLQMSDVPTWYHRSQVPRLQKEWEQKANRILNDKKYVARPGGHCTYCPFSKSKGGPCEF